VVNWNGFKEEVLGFDLDDQENVYKLPHYNIPESYLLLNEAAVTYLFMNNFVDKLINSPLHVFLALQNNNLEDIQLARVRSGRAVIGEIKKGPEGIGFNWVAQWRQSSSVSRAIRQV
jgi:hypothetical protein